MPIGACDPCGRLYQFDQKDLAQSYCPHCRRPLRLVGGKEAANPSLPVEPLRANPPGGTDS
jgi:hypothetical protein